MANYNLGSVQGEVRITYNGRGVQQAQEDLRVYRDEQGRLRDEQGRFVRAQDESTSSMGRFGKGSDDAGDKVKKLTSAIHSIAKPVFLAGAAQQAIGFAAAVGPAAGAAAVLPAVLLAGAAAMATVKIATSGMGDAFSAVASGDAAALDEAMKKLSPSAQAVVKEYQAMKPALDGLRMDVQEKAMSGLGVVAGQLGQSYLPTLRTGLGGIATEMNKTAKLSATALMQPSTVASLNVLLGNTAETTGNFGGALGDVLAGIINIAGVGSNFLPTWTTGISDITGRFREWTASAAGQEQINTWISQGASVIGQISQVLSNLAGIASGVFGAMETGSGGLLENLITLTGQMNTWVNSAEGQKTLVDVFSLLHQIFMATTDAMAVIVGIVGQIAGGFASLSPEVQGVVASMIAWGGILSEVVGFAAPIVGFLSTYSSQIMTVLRVGGLVAKLMGTISLGILKMAGTLAAAAIRMAASWLVAMGPIGWIIIAVVALVALIIYNWDWVKAKTIEIWTAVVSWLTGIWTSISAWATSIWGSITGFFTGIWDAVVLAWNTVWTAISAFLQPIWAGIIAFITGAWEIIKNIFIFVAAILLAIFFTIWNPLSELVMLIWNGIVAFLTMIWDGIVAVATTVWNLLVSVITAVWDAIWAFIQPILQTISDAISTAWNAIVSVATTVWDAVLSVITTVWDAIWGFIGPILETIGNAISSAWDTITNVISTAVNAVWNVISSIFNTISSFISGIWNSILSTISGIWSSIVGAISGGLSQAWSAISAWGAQVAGIAGQAINWLVSAGKNIVTGLWNGIVGMGAWLYNQIMGWIKSVVPGPILSFLGIASPSRYMRDEVGKQIPAGIAGGIEDNSSVASAAAAALASDVGNAAKDAAAQEVLAALGHGISVGTDFSFQGMSKNLATQKTALAEMFASSGQSDLKSFLESYLSKATTATPGTNTAGLTTGAQSTLGSLAATTGATAAGGTPAGTAVASASVAAAAAGPRMVNIGTLALSVEGNLDPTDPVRWRSAMENIRDGIRDVDRSYS